MKEEIIKRIEEYYEKYDNCSHLYQPSGTLAPHHCVELFEKTLLGEIKHYERCELFNSQPSQGL